MRGQHEVEVQARDRIGAAVAQRLSGLRQRLGLAAALGVVAPAAAQPLALLDRVVELQLQRAGADDRL
jgi:hypothetical protein